MSDDAMRNNRDAEEERQEAAYLRWLVEQTTARLLTADAQSIAIRHELEQKRRGFRLMADIAVSIGSDIDYEGVFLSVSRRINATLGMQRTAVLFPCGNGRFQARILQGYPAEEHKRIKAMDIPVTPELLEPMQPALVTGADATTRLGAFREALNLPYLIASSVMLHREVAAVLVTGRVLEQPPYLPRLGLSDVETVQTVGSYLAAMLAWFRLSQAENLARHDPLTRLPNLRGTTEQLHHILAMARRSGGSFATMFVDLDGFKQVNDTYGHATGDLVLQEVAKRLSQGLRETDFVGRIGGDEFVVGLSHVRRAEDAGHVAKKIIRTVGEPIALGDMTVTIGASVGIAIFPDHGSDESALIRAADEAMYEVKSRGKNAFAFAQR